MSEKLYKFYWDCGRAGDLEGVFIAEEKTITNAIGSEVDFGEVLGKHSYIHGTLDEDDLEVIDMSEELLAELKEKLGRTISGYNPLNYIEDEEDEETE